MRELSRRTVIGAATALSVTIAARSTAAAANIIDVTASPYNASPTAVDNTAAFQAALNDLQLSGGGVLQVPPGHYILANQLNYQSSFGSLTIVGCGSGLSILVIRHTATALDVSYTAPGNQGLILRDIGFSPSPVAGVAGTGLALQMSGAASAWPSCRIQNVDFGAACTGFSVFASAIILTNVIRSKISNCNSHSNSVQGNTFLTLRGFCVDNQVSGCTIDGYNTGVAVEAYCEGLHINDVAFSGETAVWTGSTNYNNGINLLGLYISGCELNCQSTVLWLFQVSSGWIRDTYLYGPRNATSNVACSLTGSGRLEISNCLFNGSFSATAPSNQVGIALAGSAAWACYTITIDDCSFENTLTAISFGNGTSNVTGNWLRLFSPGLSILVNDPVQYGTFTMQTVVDNSGNTTNTVGWLSNTKVAEHRVSTRRVFSR